MAKLYSSANGLDVIVTLDTIRGANLIISFYHGNECKSPSYVAHGNMFRGAKYDIMTPSWACIYTYILKQFGDTIVFIHC